MRTQDLGAGAPPEPPPGGGPPPALESGDRLSRAEFERRYEARPELTKAELIEGVVYVSSPLRFAGHARPTRHLSTWMGTYEAATPGVEGGDDATVRMDLDNEPQPDLFLRIDPARGGQSRTSPDDYVEGAPELIVEVAASSASYDLHPKLHAYRRNSVSEYMVYRAAESAVDWFVLRGGQYVRLASDERGLFKSWVFPGLWLDAQALIAGDLALLLKTLQEGMQTAEHAQFADQIARIQSRTTP